MSRARQVRLTLFPCPDPWTVARRAVHDTPPRPDPLGGLV